MKTRHLVLSIASFIISTFGVNLTAQTNNYFGTSGTLNTSVWSTNPAGPYTSALNTTSGAIINFGNAATFTGASITVAGITATANATGTAGGTISNLSNGVIAIDVGSGATLDFGSQGFTTSSTAGYIKNGNGVLALSGATYGGGFTLNAGTVIVRGVNALGGGATNTLTINGGTLAANATRDLTGKFAGTNGITIGGDFTLGASTGLASTTANLTFSNATSLGNANRTLTLGGNATYTFGGAVGGTGSSAALSVQAASGSTGTLLLSGANTYAGGTTLASGTLKLSGSGTLGSTAGTLTVSGGTLDLNGTTQGVGNFTGTGGTIVNNATGTTATLTIGNSNGTGGAFAGVIADHTAGTGTVAVTKTGSGAITLAGTNTFTGATTVSAGTLSLTGSLAAGSAVAVNSGGTLGGTGTVNGSLTLNSGGLLAPGTSLGTLTVGNGLTWNGGGLLNFDLGTGNASDRLALTGGALTKGTGTGFVFDFLNTGTAGNTYTLITSTVTSTFLANASEFTYSNLGSGLSGAFAFDGNNLQFSVTSAIPEPSTYAALCGLVALIGAVWHRRRRPGA